MIDPCRVFDQVGIADSQPTGQESTAEKWLIHKLNIASGAVSEAMENRDFADATNIAHQFFLWDLCDVFIVSA